MSFQLKRSWVASGTFLVFTALGLVLTMQNCAPQEPATRNFGSKTSSLSCELIPPSKSVFRQSEAIAFTAQFEGLQEDRYRASLYRVANPRDEQIGSGKSFVATDSFVRFNFASFSEATAVGSKNYFVRLYDSAGIPVCESDPIELTISGTDTGGTTTTIALNAPTYAPSGTQQTEVVITPQTSFAGLAYVENPSTPNVRITIGGNIGCPSNIRITRESSTEIRGTFNNLAQTASGCQVEVRYQTSNGVVVGTTASPAIPAGGSSAVLSTIVAQTPYSVRNTVSAIVMNGSFPGLTAAPTVRLTPQGCPSNPTIESFSTTQVVASFSHLSTTTTCTMDLSYPNAGQIFSVQGSVSIGAVNGVSISNVRQDPPGASTTLLKIDGSFPSVPTTGTGMIVNFAPGVGTYCPTANGTFVSATTSLVQVTFPNLTMDAMGCRLRLAYNGVNGGEFSNVNLTRPGGSSQANVNGFVLARGQNAERTLTYISIYGSYPELPEATQNFKTTVVPISGTNCPSSLAVTYEKGGTGSGQVNARYTNLRLEGSNCRFRLQYTVSGAMRSAEFVVPRIPAIPSLISSAYDNTCTNATIVGHNIAPADTAIQFYSDNGATWEHLMENGQPVQVILQAANYTASLTGQSNPAFNGKEGARFVIP
ncbi:MAG: hypothetical protein K2X47_13510, partial [Bdellovibrionales bacterium]|nr:hypothetical protein [Bdellovibrionales bacterium]